MSAAEPRLPMTSQQSAQRALRDAFSTFATGITVVTTLGDDGKPVGLTVNSFSSVSLEPPLVCWSLRSASPLVGCFGIGRSLSIHVLRQEQQHLARQFSRSAVDRFEGVAWQVGPAGAPVLGDVLARFDCRTDSIVEAGDHRMLLARVLGHTSQPGSPLLFAGGRFRGLSEAPMLDGDDYNERVWL